MIKFHQKGVSRVQIRSENHKFRNIHDKENKLTRSKIHPETELACKYNKPIYKTQYSENLFEYENSFDMNTVNFIVHPMVTSHSFTDENSYVSVKLEKSTGQIGGKLKPQDNESTRLKELSLNNSTHFGATYCEIQLDMKLDYTISRIFREMSLSELETLHQL